MTEKVVKGSLWTLVGTILPLFVGFVTTPFTVRLLGADQYGIYALVALIPAYLAFADVGMSIASTRFGSEFFSKDDPEAEARLVRTAAGIALCVSVPIAATVLVLADFIAGLLKAPDALEGQAASVIRLSALILVFNFLSGIFNTPQLARLRMGLSAAVNTTVKVASQIGVPLIIFLGYGLIDAVWFLVMMTGLGSLLHFIVSARLLPSMIGISIDRASIGPLLRFGLPLVGAAVAGVILTNGEKAIVAAGISTTALGYYTIAFSLSQVIMVTSQSLIQSLIPAFSQLQGPDRESQRNTLYSRSLRVTFLAVTPGVFLFAVLARPFLEVWVGQEFAQNSIIPLYILLTGFAFNAFAYVPYAIMISMGRTDVTNKVYWLELIPYLGFVWFMTERFGLIGAAVAWSVRTILDVAVHFYIAKRFAATRYVGAGLIRYLPGPFIAFGAMALHFTVFSSNMLASILAVVVAIAIHIALAAKFVLDASELNYVLDRAKGVLKFL